MTEEQIQTLEALYKAAEGRYNTLVDLKSVQCPLHISTLDVLSQKGLIRISGWQTFSITPLGIDKAIENRYIPSKDT